MDFIVNRKNFSECKFVEGEPAELEPGQVRLRVAKFAFTANNVTYAVAGDMLSYWNFFPAEDGWGRIPVWGIGVVEESQHDDIAEGERYFGYYPMSTHLIVQPGKAGPHGFTDLTPHRQSLPPTYNQYSRMAPEFGFDPAHDDEVMVLRVLFFTGYLIDDFLAANEFFGARAVVISSASSKTSIALAYCLTQRKGGAAEIVGLTSPSNEEFVKSLGFYDTVVPYGGVNGLPKKPAVFVDMAGDGAVIEAVHRHYGGELKHSCMVGITHWQQGGRPEGLPGPEPKMFFAPDHIQRLSKELGPAGMQERMGKAWTGFLHGIRESITIIRGEGRKDIERVYLETLAGKASPSAGHVLSM